MRRVVLSLAAVILAFSACESPVELDPDLLVYSRLSQAEFDTVADGLALTVSFSDSAEHGDAVPIVVVVTNVADTTVDIVHQAQMPYDVVVTRLDSVVVWERQYDLNLVGSSMKTLGPGESLTFEEHWDQRTYTGERVDPGTYLARGVFFGYLAYQHTNQPNLWTPPRELVIH